MDKTLENDSEGGVVCKDHQTEHYWYFNISNNKAICVFLFFIFWSFSIGSDCSQIERKYLILLHLSFYNLHYNLWKCVLWIYYFESARINDIIVCLKEESVCKVIYCLQLREIQWSQRKLVETLYVTGPQLVSLLTDE